jgi:hypothetical protein
MRPPGRGIIVDAAGRLSALAIADCGAVCAEVPVVPVIGAAVCVPAAASVTAVFPVAFAGASVSAEPAASAGGVESPLIG